MELRRRVKKAKEGAGKGPNFLRNRAKNIPKIERRISRQTKHTKMEDILKHLVSMQNKIDLLTEEVQRLSVLRTPSSGDADAPGAPKKRGRPSKKDVKPIPMASLEEGQEPKPKKVLSPEHLAKLKEGREKKKAEKEAAAAAAATTG